MAKKTADKPFDFEAAQAAAYAGHVRPPRSTHGGARPGAGRPSAEVDTTRVSIPSPIAAKAQFVAATRKVSITQYLADVLGATVDRDFRESVKKEAPDIAAP